MTHYIKTDQSIKMFDICTLDGQMIQKIGHYGDGDIFETIDWDHTIDPIELDLDLVTYYDTEETY